MIKLTNVNNHEDMWVMVANIQHVQTTRQSMAIIYMQSGQPLGVEENPATVADKVNAYLTANRS